MTYGVLSVWNEPRIEELRHLWKQGLSATKIAIRLGHGLSRNAVISAARRYGCAGRPSPIREKGSGKPHRVAEPKPARIAKPKPEPSLPLVVLPRKRQAPESTVGAVTQELVQPGQCRWIVADAPAGHDARDALMCAQPVSPTSHFQFCPCHCERAFGAQRVSSEAALGALASLNNWAPGARGR